MELKERLIKFLQNEYDRIPENNFYGKSNKELKKQYQEVIDYLKTGNDKNKKTNKLLQKAASNMVLFCGSFGIK